MPKKMTVEEFVAFMKDWAANVTCKGIECSTCKLSEKFDNTGNYCDTFLQMEGKLQSGGEE